MKFSDRGFKLLKSLEPCYLTAIKVKDIWCVGYNFTGEEVNEGYTLSQENADSLLREFADSTAEIVLQHLERTVNQNEFDALVSVAYNVGAQAFSTCSILNLIKPASESPFKWCRLAITPYQIGHAKLFIKILNDLGYKIVVNIMQIALLNNTQIEECVTKLNDIKEIEILYFADSFGSLTPDTTKNITEIFLKNTDKPIGIHTHDNMGLAFANVLAAVNSGVTYVDGTYKGMGRGVGNVKLEQILMYDKKDNIQLLVDFLENYIV